ncbi:MAG: hypothetical protein AB7F32_08430 [Victivallaceae bacterium]
MKKISAFGKVYLIVALAALLVRVVFFYYWEFSPLAVFHQLDGLDMKTHLELGALCVKGQVLLTPYRLLTGLLPAPWAIVCCQMAMGTLTALLATWIAFRLTGAKFYALFAGLATAAYAPALLYEMMTLQESLTAFLAAAAVAAVLNARRRRFANGPVLLAGIALALAATGRPATVPLVGALTLWLAVYLVRRRRKLRPVMLTLALGMLLVWGPTGIYNGIKFGWPLPFYGGNIGYLATVGSRASIESWDITEDADAATPAAAPRIVSAFIKKVPLLFAPYEIPDNLNFHFISDKFAPFDILPGPGLCWPLGLAGIVLLFWSGQWRRRQGLMLLYFGTLLLLVTAYYPTGRHRMLLYPALMLLAVYPFYSRPLKRSLPLAAALLAAGLFFIPANLVRPGDNFNWALALEKMPNPTEDPAKIYLFNYRNSFSEIDFARLVNYLIKKSRYQEASAVVLSHPVKSSFYFYYLGLLELVNNNPSGAEMALSQVRIGDLPEMAASCYFYYGEALRLGHKNSESLAAYRKALASNPGENQKRRIELAIGLLNLPAPSPSPTGP